jgi:hypothetical protein
MCVYINNKQYKLSKMAKQNTNFPISQLSIKLDKNPCDCHSMITQMIIQKPGEKKRFSNVQRIKNCNINDKYNYISDWIITISSFNTLQKQNKKLLKPYKFIPVIIWVKVSNMFCDTFENHLKDVRILREENFNVSYTPEEYMEEIYNEYVLWMKYVSKIDASQFMMPSEKEIMVHITDFYKTTSLINDLTMKID